VIEKSPQGDSQLATIVSGVRLGRADAGRSGEDPREDGHLNRRHRPAIHSNGVRYDEVLAALAESWGLLASFTEASPSEHTFDGLDLAGAVLELFLRQSIVEQSALRGREHSARIVEMPRNDQIGGAV